MKIMIEGDRNCPDKCQVNESDQSAQAKGARRNSQYKFGWRESWGHKDHSSWD